MVLLEILGGWFLLSCVSAPLIGRFIATNATIAEDDEALAAACRRNKHTDLKPAFYVAARRSA